MMTMAEDIVVLREILQRELETINAYEKMLERVGDPTLKQIIEHVTDEEREHVAEMYQLIMARDPKQLARSLKVEQNPDYLPSGGKVAPTVSALATDLVAPARPSPIGSLSPTAAAEAGLNGPLVVPVTVDPFPPPPPIFPDGAWSVGTLKRGKPRGPGAPTPGS